RFGRAAREANFVRTCRADVIRHALPRSLISLGCTSAQRVQSAMHIRVVALIKIPERVDNGTRLLRTRSAIKVNQVMAAYLLTQDREILANNTPVHLARDSFMHAIICYPADNAPVYSHRTTKC